MQLFKKIAYELKLITVNGLIRLSIIMNWPLLTALALATVTGQTNASGRPIVLCLRRSIFLRDIEALQAHGKRLSYRLIGRNYLHLILRLFIGPKKFSQITEETYHQDPTCSDEKEKLFAYLKKVIPYWRKFTRFDAVMAANFGYREQQELARACQELNLPFIVLNKEGIVVPGAYDNFTGQFKNRKFIGAKMLCYNELIANSLLKLKIDGLTPDKIQIVGVPRLDYYFKLPADQQPQKQVTLFSFYPYDKFSYLNLNQNQTKAIYQKAKEFHKYVIRFAANHPDIKVFIKTKVAKHYVDYVEDILRENFSQPIRNLIITHAGNPFELIRDSLAVLGFNSTTMIEAIIARKVIISPYFGDILTDREWDYFKEYPELVNYATSQEQLEDYILNFKNYANYNPLRKNEFLEQFIHTPDGQASLRAEDAIIQLINKYREI